MPTIIYVSSLSPETTNDKLVKFFSKAGDVVSASIMKDNATGLSKCFGYVSMKTEEGAITATTLNDEELNGYTITVTPDQEFE